MTEGRRWLRWWDYAIALGIAALYVVLLLKTANNLGYARDEGFYFSAAESYAHWFEQLVKAPKEALTRSVVDRYWSANHEHPALAKSAFALSWMLLYKKWHLFAEEGTSFRFPGMLSSGLVLAILYVWGTRARSRAAGVAAALAFAFMPRVFYQSHLDCFDIPIVAAWLACAYAYWRSLTGGGLRWALATGVLFGLALNTKHNSWFLPIAFVTHTLLLQLPAIRKELRAGTTSIPAALPMMAVIGPLLFWAMWPWIWNDTGGRLENYVGFHMGHEYYNMEFFGVTWWKPPMPRGYAWIMTAATIPIVTLVCMAIGMVTIAVARIRGKSERPYEVLTALLWAVGIAINYSAWLSSKTPIFGGTKHWMTAYPFLALFAGAGFDWILIKARASAVPVITNRFAGPALIGAACLAAPVVETVRSHPYGLSNYTPLVGGAAGAATLGLNRGFWGFTTGSVLPWLNKHAPNGATVFPHDTAWQSWDMLVRDGRARRDLRLVGTPSESQFGLYHHEPHMLGVEYQYWVSYGTAAPAYVPLYDGVPVVWVYARPGVAR